MKTAVYLKMDAPSPAALRSKVNSAKNELLDLVLMRVKENILLSPWCR